MNCFKYSLFIFLCTFFSLHTAKIKSMELQELGKKPHSHINYDLEGLEALKAELPLLNSEDDDAITLKQLSCVGLKVLAGASLLVAASFGGMYGITQDVTETLIGGSVVSIGTAAVSCSAYNIYQYLQYKRVEKYVKQHEGQSLPV